MVRAFRLDGIRDTTDPAGDPFEWIEFGSDGTVQTGHLEVPIDDIYYAYSVLNSQAAGEGETPVLFAIARRPIRAGAAGSPA